MTSQCRYEKSFNVMMSCFGNTNMKCGNNQKQYGATFDCVLRFEENKF